MCEALRSVLWAALFANDPSYFSPFYVNTPHDLSLSLSLSRFLFITIISIIVVVIIFFFLLLLLLLLDLMRQWWCFMQLDQTLSEEWAVSLARRLPLCDAAMMPVLLLTLLFDYTLNLSLLLLPPPSLLLSSFIFPTFPLNDRIIRSNKNRNFSTFSAHLAPMHVYLHWLFFQLLTFYYGTTHK